jgi:uncharacterized protein YkwD
VLLVGVVLPSLAAAPSAQGACTPVARGAAGMRAGLLCHVNAARRAHALRHLAASEGLTRVAQAHAHDMVRRHYFSHVSPGGASLQRRLGRSVRGVRQSGEALGWGCGLPARPRAIVQAWLASPPHRALVLSRTFRFAGAGVARHTPAGGCSSGATWVLVAAR